jgi:hypothetical protein
VRLTGDRAGLWLDFASGEKGDMIGLWKAVTGLSLKDSFTAAAEFMGIEVEDENPTKPSESWLQLQRQMGEGTKHDIAALQALRKLPTPEGIELAIDSRLLFFGPVFDRPQGSAGAVHHSWILTDDSRRGAQARRMDGQPWESTGAKAKTIQGTTARWPVGIAHAKTLDIALVEGGPDALAACTALAMLGMDERIQTVSMLGSSQTIHPDAVKLFRGKTVWMFPHHDENMAGIIGAIKWAKSLELVGARIIPFDFRPYPGVKDLNDFVSALGKQATQPEPELQTMEIGD